MSILYTESEFNSATYKDALSVKCDFCGKIHTMLKVVILRNNRKSKFSHHCSEKCRFGTTNVLSEVSCLNCGITFNKRTSEIKETRNNFCSCTCSGLYSSSHKTSGCRRSKLEIYLEKELINLYPDLEISCNNRNVLGIELDIYIPNLDIAFEINGIVHYIPIFGESRFQQTKILDESKLKECINKNIDLHVIDSSKQLKFKPENSQEYLNYITTIINNKLAPKS